MTKEIEDTWKKYKLGLIHKDSLTSEMKKEIEACDFAMNMLLPTKKFLKACSALGGFDKVVISDERVDILSKIFEVPKSITYIKLQTILKEIQQVNSKKLIIK